MPSLALRLPRPLEWKIPEVWEGSVVSRFNPEAYPVYGTKKMGEGRLMEIIVEGSRLARQKEMGKQWRHRRNYLGRISNKAWASPSFEGL